MPQLTPDDDPNAQARCPLQLLGDPTAPRCRALVLVRDAAEHERWHHHLDSLLEHGAGAGVVVAPWPAQNASEPMPDPQQLGSSL